MEWNAYTSDTPLFIQGMTGKEGSRLAQWLLTSGTRVVAGITPGKGGSLLLDQPIFDSVREAREVFPEVEVSILAVPAAQVRKAAEEALQAGIRFLTIFSEGVPVHDALAVRRLAEEKKATVLGPGSVGYLQFPAFRTGYIGGESPWPALHAGGVALISTSGGMANELMMAFAREQIGLRFVFAIGGDRFPAFSLEEALQVCEASPLVQKIVLFTEPGRTIFETLLSRETPCAKAFTLFLAGEFLDDLPREQAYGHTGTLLGADMGTVREMRQRLQAKGIHCVSTVEACLQANK